MRRHQRERLAIGFLGRELRWMALGITTLVVLFLLIVKLRDEGAAARLAAGNQPASEPSSAAAIARLPPPTGPTDEDEEESEAAKEDFQAITDGTIGLDQVEMFAYNRLVSWVKSQSFARLWARARKNPAYTYLYDDAAGQRGALVALDVEIRQACDAGKTETGVQLYEASATTQQSGSHLYELLIVDFPVKMPVGTVIREKARFAGYFLKVHGYKPRAAQPGRPPERAPLLIGRLDWKPTAAPAETGIGRGWGWIVAGLALLLLAWGLQFLLWKRRAPTAGRSARKPPAGGVIPVEDWLDQCAAGLHEEERRTDDSSA